MRWGDQLLPEIGDGMWWVKTGNPLDPNSPWVAEPCDETGPWWDPEKAADAARVLIEDIPAMLRYWNRTLSPVPGRDGCDTIERLRVALDAAMPFIEFPFGEYDREEARKRRLHPKRPKSWHASAIAVAYVIIPALQQSGHTVRGTSHDTIAVRIVHDALDRMRYGKIGRPAIAKILTKWVGEYGLPAPLDDVASVEALVAALNNL
jgi:hypothetical protein